MSNRFRGLIAQAAIDVAGEKLTIGYRPGVIDQAFKEELKEQDKEGNGVNWALKQTLVDLDFNEPGKLEPVTDQTLAAMPDFVKMSIWKFVFNVTNPILRSLESRTTSAQTA